MWSITGEFKDLRTDDVWQPMDFDYNAFLNTAQVMNFAVNGGINPPKNNGEGKNLFPYQLNVQFDAFAFGFVGGMLCDEPTLKGSVYGVKGSHNGGQILGLYQLESNDKNHPTILGVHHGKLYVGDIQIPSSSVHGNTLQWNIEDEDLATQTSLPTKGHLTFSTDGKQVIDSSIYNNGNRISPEVASNETHSIVSFAKGIEISKNQILGSQSRIGDLANMSQFEHVEDGYRDKVKIDSMTDFYQILQYYMDSDDREQFFDVDPPTLCSDLKDISLIRGEDDADPEEWYKSLGIAYTSAALGKWNTDPAAKMLNVKRASLWLKKESTNSSVMKVQSPLLYANSYKKIQNNPGVKWYLSDQKSNAKKYEPFIDKKVAEWVKEWEDNYMDDPDNPDAKAKAIQEIKDLGEIAKKEKLYWAFVFYTYTTMPRYFLMLKGMMINGSQADGSMFGQRVNRTVALLGVLDTSSHFSQKYSELLQVFQLGSVLPELMNYSGDIKDFNIAVQQMIEQFITNNIDSPDPKMKEAAEQLKTHASLDNIDSALKIFKNAGLSTGGLYNWSMLVNKFESGIARFLGKIPERVAMFIGLAGVGLIITFFITGQVDWNSLSISQKASIITSGVGVLVTIVMAIVKRGVVFRAIFEPASGVWKGVKLFFSKGLMTAAQESSAIGFKGWLVGSKGFADYPSEARNLAQFEHMAEDAAELEASAAKVSRVQKIFGKSFSEFMATRVGAFLAVVGIIMSAYMLAQGGTAMSIASNAIFLFSSVLEFVAIVGGWIISAITATTLGTVIGLAIASTIFSIISVIGFVAMVAGVILMLVEMFSPKETAAEKFAREKAGDFFMPEKTDIDYFENYKNDNEPQRSGISIFTDEEYTNAVTISNEGTLSLKPFDGSGHTAFYIKVDDQGRAKIGAPLYDKDDKPLFNILGMSEDGKMTTFKSTTDQSVDEGPILWHAEIQGEGEFEDKHLHGGKFKLYNEYWYKLHNTKRYLSVDGNEAVKATDNDGSILNLQMVTTKPILMMMEDISWHTYQHDMKQGPGFIVPGSQPKEYKITPDLPSGLNFDTETGVVSMEVGKDIQPAAHASYHLEVSNAAGKTSVYFNIEVKDDKIDV